MPNKCILPWMSIETSPTGSARPCCLYREEITNSNGIMPLQQYTLTEMFTSDYMKGLRQQFREGKQPAGCKSCFDEEASGRQSKRISSHYLFDHFNVDYDAEPTDIKFVDLKLGNICNIKCRICGSWSSSKWASEELAYTPDVDKKDHQAYTFLRKGAWPRESPKFWEDLEELLPNIEYFEFTGGEPFLIREHFELLQRAVDKGFARKIKIHYNTNATTFEPEFVDIWKHFKCVEIAFSIDNLYNRFEYERYGAKWDRAQEIITTVNGLRKEYPNFQTQVCMTINVFNVLYLEELCKWVQEQRFTYDYFNMLHGHHAFRIDMMTPEAKALVLDRLTNGDFTPEHRREINNLINFINNGPGSDGKEFISKVKQTDAFREQCILDTHREIAEAMGYFKE